MATWDDHDYGRNNAGESFFGKQVAKEEFLKFFNVPMNDQRRAHGGIYTSYTFGPHGKRLQVILLDDRWFKNANTILGDEQWEFLAAELAKPADLRIVASGMQFLGNLFEGFYEQPCELEKLLSIMPDNVVLISGDRHIGGFYQVDAMGAGVYGGSFPDNLGNPVKSLNKADYKNTPLLEVTASSLTHAWNEAGLELGNNRVPGYDIVRTDHFGQVRAAALPQSGAPALRPAVRWRPAQCTLPWPRASRAPFPIAPRSLPHADRHRLGCPHPPRVARAFQHRQHGRHAQRDRRDRNDLAVLPCGQAGVPGRLRALFAPAALLDRPRVPVWL